MAFPTNEEINRHQEMWRRDATLLNSLEGIFDAADAARIEGADETPKAPTQIANDIVGQFAWCANVMIRGKLVGQQYAVAELIADAIEDERERHFRQQAEIERLRSAGAFLCDRLDEFENEEDAAAYHGHVTSAKARLRAAMGVK